MDCSPQVNFVLGLLKGCLEKGVVTEQMLRDEMARNHLRQDALEVLERTPPLAACGATRPRVRRYPFLV